MPKITIVLADDHPMLREGLAAVIANEPDMELIGQASNGREAVEQYHSLQPDIMLVDLQMPELDGIQAVQQIRQVHPSARIIVLTTYAGDVLAHRALAAGARAYVLKGSLRKDLIDTIRAVARGLKRVDPDIAATMAQHTGEDLLTEREIAVLKLAALGNSNKETAVRLSITEQTVKGHMASVLRKLSAKDRTHAVTIALTRGIIQL
jgi:DNA-binding NarL/FixJ family response regulator